MPSLLEAGFSQGLVIPDCMFIFVLEIPVSLSVSAVTFPQLVSRFLEGAWGISCGLLTCRDGARLPRCHQSFPHTVCGECYLVQINGISYVLGRGQEVDSRPFSCPALTTLALDIGERLELGLSLNP